jgi:hypothetical protein
MIDDRERILGEIDGLRDELRGLAVHSGSVHKVERLARRIEALEASLNRVDRFTANIRRLADQFYRYQASMESRPAHQTWTPEARRTMGEMSRIRGELSRAIRQK